MDPCGFPRINQREPPAWTTPRVPIVLRHPGGLSCAYRMQSMSNDCKSSRWAFTAYEQQWELFATMPPLIAEWGWQEELCPETNRKHYQGYLRTVRQTRFAALKKVLPGVHLEVAKNWDALVNYCKKETTAVAGSQVHETTGVRSLTMAEALIKVAEYRPRDINFAECESVKDFREKYQYEFEVAVGKLLEIQENLVGLYSQPQYQRAYVIWRSVWVKKSDARQTDRQTNSPAAEPASGEVRSDS